MNIILWIISLIISIIVITGIVGLMAIIFNDICWHDSWLDKMLIVNANILLCIIILTILIITTWCIQNILSKLIK